MGLIILPFFVVVFFVFTKAVLRIIKLIKAKEFINKDFALGSMLTALIFAFVIIKFAIEKRVNGFSPLLEFPFFMILIPYFFSMSTYDRSNEKIRKVSKYALTSIFFSGILLFALIISGLDIFEILKLEATH